MAATLLKVNAFKAPARQLLCGWRAFAVAAEAAQEPSNRLQSAAFAFLQVPQQQLPFHIAPVQGKGLGAVAIRDIKCGERVLAERPVLSYSCPKGSIAWRADLESQFQALSPELKDEVMSLFDACVSSSEKSLEGVVMSNAMTRDETLTDAALLLLVSRFNHSCIPNLEQSWDPETGEAHLFSAREIKAGEELCSYYVDLIATKEQRAESLWARYRFRCQCPACEPGDPDSDFRRRRIASLTKELNKDGPKNPDRGVKVASFLLSFLDQEGLALFGQRKWHCLLATEFSLKQGNLDEAKKWIQRAVDYSRLAHGEEHSNTRWLVELQKDPTVHPSWAEWVQRVRIRNGLLGVAGLFMVGTTVAKYVKFPWS